MSAAAKSSKLDLVPWDFDSEDHTQRAYLQRVACGWRWDEVPEWVDKCKAGKMMVYWLVISETVPDRDAQIKTHISKYPKESNPLTDSAPQSWISRPRTPSNNPIHPIGHIAITLPPPSELSRLGLPSDWKVAYIGKLYVSYALQSYGYGGAAMRGVEAVARDEDGLGADVAVLDSVTHEYQMREDVMEVFYGRQGNPLPKISNEHWYLKLGYEKFHQEDEGYLHTHFDTGEKEWLPVCYFKKMLK